MFKNEFANIVIHYLRGCSIQFLVKELINYPEVIWPHPKSVHSIHKSAQQSSQVMDEAAITVTLVKVEFEFIKRRLALKYPVRNEVQEQRDLLCLLEGKEVRYQA